MRGRVKRGRLIQNSASLCFSLYLTTSCLIQPALLLCLSVSLVTKSSHCALACQNLRLGYTSDQSRLLDGKIMNILLAIPDN
jgi:hypothetical protein